MIHNPYDDTYLLSLIAIIDALCDEILEDTVAIREVTDAEAILTETGGTITTDGTEQTVYVNENPAGIFEPRVFKLDFTNQTAAETVEIKTYYKIAFGGAYIKDGDTAFAGVQDPLLKNVHLEPTRFGVKVTIEQTAGQEYHAYAWEVFYEEAP